MELMVEQKYKQTEVGAIPVDWAVSLLDDNSKRGSGHTPSKRVREYYEGNIVWISLADSNKLDSGIINKSEITISKKGIANSSATLHPKGIVLMSRDAGIGKSAIAGCDLCVSQHFMTWLCNERTLHNWYLYYWLQYRKPDFERIAIGSTIKTIGLPFFKQYKIPLPKYQEQTAIANALNDTDTVITELEKLIAKKRNIKQGAMQELLRPKEGWEVKSLFNLIDCLDNLRIPLNERERNSRRGDYPYCGANGILDFVDDYIIDDSIILIAEDGGYFDEYLNRPIAYRMTGKCWVNNHAHILKAKNDFCQDFIYYSLVHKNILKFLSSGTRAKLNKSELYKIEIDISGNVMEQYEIAQTLSDMDTEIDALERKLVKYKEIKQGMMQVLLTGKVRLV